MKQPLLITGPMYPPTLAELEQAYEAHRLWTAPDRDALIASVADKVTAVASSNSGGIDAATIAKLPKLKVIAHFGVGYDTVDVDAAKARGIAVTNTPDVLTEEVADLAMALLLATVRRVPQGDRYVREGKWLKGRDGAHREPAGQDRRHRRHGAHRPRDRASLRGLRREARLPGAEPQGRPRLAALRRPVALAKDCDVVIVACPGGEATRGAW